MGLPGKEHDERRLGDEESKGLPSRLWAGRECEECQMKSWPEDTGLNVSFVQYELDNRKSGGRVRWRGSKRTVG